MPQALQIGNDPLLMQSRNGLLASAGLRTLNLVGAPEALDRIPSAQWDVAILCHTLSTEDHATAVAALRRRNPFAPILVIARSAYANLRKSDEVDFTLSSNPASLVSSLRKLVHGLSQVRDEKSEPQKAAC